MAGRIESVYSITAVVSEGTDSMHTGNGLMRLYEVVMETGVGVWVSPEDPVKRSAIIGALSEAGVLVDEGPREYAIGGSTIPWFMFLDGSWIELVRAVGIGAGGAVMIGAGKGLKKLFVGIFKAKQESDPGHGGITFIDNSTNVWVWVGPDDLDLPNSEWDKLAQLKPEEHTDPDGDPSSVVHKDPDGGWTKPN